MKAVSREPACRALFLTIFFALQAACASESSLTAPDTSSISDTSSESSFIAPDTSMVSAGDFIMGSDDAEREYAYQLDEAAYGHSRTRTGGWYDSERNRAIASTESFAITTSPVTNAQYKAFIDATGHDAPDVDQQTWDSYGLIHPFARTRKFAWANNQLPAGRENHPVVMVSYADAEAYARWLSRVSGQTWRLPSEAEWEKAVRGIDGRIFPWGDTFDSGKLNSHDAGPFDTVAVGSSSTIGPFGLVDGAGQVFEWIHTPDTATQTVTRAWVKGGSWDDSGCGVCRPAARHSRPKTIRHILIGFRLVKTQ